MVDNKTMQTRHAKFRFVLLSSISLSIIAASLVPIEPAVAGLAMSDWDYDADNTGGAAAPGSSGNFKNGAITSNNGFAAVGDGDCGRIGDSAASAAGDGALNPLAIWGNGDDQRTGGIYGSTSQNSQSNGYDTPIHGNGSAFDGLAPYGGGNPQNSGNVYTGNTQATQTQAFGLNTQAIGCDSRANGMGSTAMGWGAWATGAGSVAFGMNSRATGQGTLAFGIYAQATGESSIAQGTSSVANNKGTTAIGALTTASGENATAIGSGDVQGENIINGAQATGDRTVALGYKSSAESNDSIALGAESVANTAAGELGKNYSGTTSTAPAWQATRGAVSVGDADSGVTRQITGVAAGTQETDAVNIAQLNDLQTYADGKITKNSTDIATNYQDMADALGGDAIYTGSGWIGPNYKIKQVNGENYNDPQTYTDVGGALTALDTNVGAVNNRITETNSGINNGTMGTVQRKSDGTLVLIGQGGTADSPGGNQVLTGVADGTKTYDAVNLGQLNSLETKTKETAGSYYSEIADSLGGGAMYRNGTWVGPSYEINQVNGDDYNNPQSLSNVGEALTALDTNVGAVNNRITETNSGINNGTMGTVQRKSDGTLVLIGQGGTADSPGGNQVLTGVADGTKTYDAVNLGQLNSLETSINSTAGSYYEKIADSLGGGAMYRNGTWVGPSYEINQVNGDDYNDPQSLSNVGEALGALDSNVGAVNNRITETNNGVKNGEIGSVQKTSDGSFVLVSNPNSVNGSAPGAAQKLSNIADGTLSESSTDAVNGSQLFATNQNVETNKNAINTNATNIQANTDTISKVANNTNSYLGGGANVLNGQAPTFSVQGDTANSVNGAFGLVDTGLTNVNTRIDNINTGIGDGTLGPVQRDANGNLVLVNKDQSAATPGDAIKLTNVANGTDANDAVNFGQLSETNTKINTVADNTSSYLGGGADVAAGTAPTFTTQAGSVNNVADAFTNVNNSFNTVNGNISDLQNGAAGTVQRGNGNQLVLIGPNGTDATNSDSPQRLSNVADGTKANDAVNFGQLDSINTNVKINKLGITTNANAIDTNKEQIQNNAKYTDEIFGGNTDIAGGVKPTFTTQAGSVNNVADAFTNVNNSFNTVNGNISDLQNGAAGPVQRGSGNQLVLIGPNGTDATNSDSPQRLSNVADGTEAHDAVNFSQLDSTNTKVKMNQLEISTNANAIDTNKEQIQNNAKYTNEFFGGGADVAAGTAPTFTTQAGSVNNVADAFTNVNNSFEDVKDGKMGPVQRSTDGSLVLVGQDGSAADPKGEQKLTNVAGGTLSESSTDAVNGSQLFATNQNVETNKNAINTNAINIQANTDTISTVANNTNNYLGGGADVLNGQAPTFTVQGDEANSVNGAFGLVDTGLTNVNTRIDNINTGIGDGTLGPVQRDANGNLVLVNKDQSASTPGDAIKLTNVANGTDANDAVNFSQLSETNTKVNTVADNTSSYLGGGADVASGTDPTFTTQAGSVNNVADAFTNVNNSFNTVNGNISDLQNGAAGPVQRGSGNELVLVSPDTGSTAAKPGSSQKLTNVAIGEVGIGSTDAINGSQLYGTTLDVEKNQLNISTNAGAINTNKTQITENAKYTNQYFGGGADVAGGIEPTFTTQAGSAYNVADAFTNVNNSFEDVKDGKMGPVQRDEDGSLVLVGQDGSAADPKGEQKLTNVADGTLSESSTDAVNGSQLFATNQNVETNKNAINTNAINIQANTDTISTVANNTNNYLGGGADVLNGQAPTFTVQGDEANSVNGAFGLVDTGLTNVNTRIDNINTGIGDGTLGPVQRDANGNLVLVNKDQSASTPGDAIKLTNVANGTDANDAVNFSQLSETNTKVNTVADNTSSYLGGGADVASGTDPTFTTQAGSVNNVADAFTNVNNSFEDVKDGKMGPVQRDEDGTLVLVGQDGSAADPKGEQKLTNIAGGALSATSTDAVNGSQLFATNQYFQDALGSGNIVDGTAPSFITQKGNVDNVTDAFANVNTSIGDINSDINDINTGKAGPVQRDENGNLNLVDKNGNTSSPTGEEPTLGNVGAGEISATSTDAVNGSQLFATNQNIDATNTQLANSLGGGATYTNGNFSGPSYNIRAVNGSNYSGGQSYNNVGDALGALDNNIGDVNDRVNQVASDVDDINNGKAGPVQRDENGNLNLVDENGNTTSPDGEAPTLGNVGAGDVSEGSTDAVNGGQLWEVDQKVDNNTDRIDNLEDNIGDIGNKVDNAVQYDDENKDSITMGGSDASKPVSITNVADGKVEEGSKDAVNGGQLYEVAGDTLNKANDYTDQKVAGAVDEANAYTDMKFNSLNRDIADVRKEARTAAAIGLAAASLRFDDTPGKASLGFGVGYWKGEQAMAFGGGYTSENGGIRGNITGTIADGSLGVGAGVTFRLN